MNKFIRQNFACAVSSKTQGLFSTFEDGKNMILYPSLRIGKTFLAHMFCFPVSYHDSTPENGFFQMSSYAPVSTCIGMDNYKKTKGKFNGVNEEAVLVLLLDYSTLKMLLWRF